MLSSSSSSSIEVANNNDILIQILLLLPVKSLLVFKSVSKEWFAIISDPLFIRNHCLQNRHCTITGLFLYISPSLYDIRQFKHPEYEFIPLLDGSRSRRNKITNVPTPPPPFRTLTFVNVPKGIRIQQSCNGLLCCSDATKWDRSERTYYIYNPSTKQYRPIVHGSRSVLYDGSSQAAQKQRCLGEICGVSLAFDPIKSPDHYEVVCIWMRSNINPSQECYQGFIYQIEIYSSRTASWRLSGDAFALCCNIFNVPGVYWNGCLHWINMLNIEPSRYFDIERELLQIMPAPPIPDGLNIRQIEYFGECRGHLYLIEIYDTPRTHFDIMEMDTEYRGWNVKYRVNLEPLAFAHPEIVKDRKFSYVTWPPCDFKVWLVQEDEEDSKMVFQLRYKVFSCDLKEMKFKKIHEFAAPTTGELHDREGTSPLNWTGWFNPYQYIETLAHV